MNSTVPGTTEGNRSRVPARVSIGGALTMLVAFTRDECGAHRGLEPRDPDLAVPVAR